MAIPTKYRFLKLTSKGKIKPNPIDVDKLTPSELKKYGLLEDSEKGLTKDKGLVPRVLVNFIGELNWAVL